MWSLLHKSPVEPAVTAPDTRQWTCTAGRPSGPEGGMTAWWPEGLVKAVAFAGFPWFRLQQLLPPSPADRAPPPPPLRKPRAQRGPGVQGGWGLMIAGGT